MGRLKAIGSGTSLRQGLFPEGFAGEVMQLMLKTWLTFSKHHDVRLEERITAVFRDALIEAYVAAGRNWFVTLEDPITDPTFGTETGRNDLRFYHRDIPGQHTFLTVECKRLHVVIGHFKLGHPWSLQNRPPDKDLLFRLGPVF